MQVQVQVLLWVVVVEEVVVDMHHLMDTQCGDHLRLWASLQVQQYPHPPHSHSNFIPACSSF